MRMSITLLCTCSVSIFLAGNAFGTEPGSEETAFVIEGGLSTWSGDIVEPQGNGVLRWGMRSQSAEASEWGLHAMGSFALGYTQATAPKTHSTFEPNEALAISDISVRGGACYLFSHAGVCPEFHMGAMRVGGDKNIFDFIGFGPGVELASSMGQWQFVGAIRNTYFSQRVSGENYSLAQQTISIGVGYLVRP